ncbi:MAG TPA: vWA domain-containing protein, partial [Vicinamibacteria bacterium]|nr:vWA domain-containing protein [Vicinamibacteria bacterium]
MAPSLEPVFEFLFKYRPFLFEKGRFVMAGPGIAAAGLAMGAAVVVLSYRRAPGAARRGERLALAAVRTAALAVLLFCLCRPALVLQTVVPQQSFLGVLLDDSRSMRIADEGEPRGAFVTKSLGPEAPLLKALAARYKLRFFRFSDTTDRIDGVSNLTFSGRQTSLSGAIERASQDLASVPLAGLVLFTDGADNGTSDAADLLPRLRARGVPLFTVGLGRERFAKDVELTRVEIPSSVLKGTSVTAEVRVAQRGFGGAKVQLQVEDSGRLLQSQEITLPADGEAGVARVHIAASEAGPRTFRFRVTPQPGETIVENNQQDVPVDVMDRREKILYFEG